MELLINMESITRGSITFSIIDTARKEEIEKPSPYLLVKIAKDKSDNVYFKFIHEDIKKFFVTFQSSDIGKFVEALKRVTYYEENITISVTGLDWFVFFYPKTATQENEMWLCDLETVGKDGDLITFSFSWKHYGMERGAVMQEIERFSRSEPMNMLVKSLKDAEEVYVANPGLGMKESLKKFSEQYKDRLNDLSTFTVNRIEMAKKICGYTDFGNYMMKEQVIPARIVMELFRETLEGMINDLESIRAIEPTTS